MSGLLYFILSTEYWQDLNIMSPEKKEKLNQIYSKAKELKEPLRKNTSFIAILLLVIQSYFDSTKQQMASDINTIKVVQQHMSKQQEENSYKFMKYEDRMDYLELKLDKHEENDAKRFTTIWENKQNKPNL